MLLPTQIKSIIYEKEKDIPIDIRFIYCIIIILIIISANYGFFVFMIIILTGGILYTIVFKVLTKTIPGFKSIYVTMIWAYAGTFYVSIFKFFRIFHFLCSSIFLFIFIKMLINVVYFDIKDMNRDKKENLQTLPILIGKINTIALLNILNILALDIMYIGYTLIFYHYIRYL